MFSWMKNKLDDAIFEAKWKADDIGTKFQSAKESFERGKEELAGLADEFKNLPKDSWDCVNIEEDLKNLSGKYDSIYKIIIFCHLQDFVEVEVEVGNGSEQRGISVATAGLKRALKITHSCRLTLKTTRDAANWIIFLSIKPISNVNKLKYLKLALEHCWISFDVYSLLLKSYEYRVLSEKNSGQEVSHYAEYLQGGVILEDTVKKLTKELIDSNVFIK